MNINELKEDVKRVLKEGKDGSFQWAGDGHWWVTIIIDDKEVKFIGDYVCCSQDCESNYYDTFDDLEKLIEWAEHFGPWEFLGEI